MTLRLFGIKQTPSRLQRGARRWRPPPLRSEFRQLIPEARSPIFAHSHQCTWERTPPHTRGEVPTVKRTVPGNCSGVNQVWHALGISDTILLSAHEQGVARSSLSLLIPDARNHLGSTRQFAAKWRWRDLFQKNHCTWMAATCGGDFSARIYKNLFSFCVLSVLSDKEERIQCCNERTRFSQPSGGIQASCLWYKTACLTPTFGFPLRARASRELV